MQNQDAGKKEKIKKNLSVQDFCKTVEKTLEVRNVSLFYRYIIDRKDFALIQLFIDSLYINFLANKNRR